mmetsp:Transcript_9533/g.11785  ORF Transcript_9533/g.11785 Transcript_9533/m.11785 type:complete len:100 (-) Transcript_9533:524-823(-)
MIKGEVAVFVRNGRQSGQALEDSFRDGGVGCPRMGALAWDVLESLVRFLEDTPKEVPLLMPRDFRVVEGEGRYRFNEDFVGEDDSVVIWGRERRIGEVR